MLLVVISGRREDSNEVTDRVCQVHLMLMAMAMRKRSQIGSLLDCGDFLDDESDAEAQGPRINCYLYHGLFFPTLITFVEALKIH